MKAYFYFLAVLCLCVFSKVQIQAADTIPPTVTQIQPPPGAITILTNVTLTFSEAVAGLQASDLLINDVPASAKSGSNTVFTFYFSQPPPGFISVKIDADTSITDLDGNSFNALATNWSYTLADSIPPTMLFSTPASNATVTALTQIEVVFSEPVTGVDAADLQINGQGATSLTLLAADHYIFSFAQPPAGNVAIGWAAGHGIRDLAPTPNNFAGIGWSCTLNPGAARDVVINEFLADNLTSLADADGQKTDWIELFNRGTSAVNLTGWALSDDPADSGRWTFPSISLAPGQYLLVFASGKDRKGAELHSNFGLNLSGGYLGLFDSHFPHQVVSQFADYPEQRGDISYGRDAAGAPAYFTILTPRATNNVASAVIGFVQPPHPSVDSGLFNSPFNLALSTETPGATIRFTLDGNQPTSTNTPYSAPIPISGTPTQGVAIVRAVGFKAGMAPSTITTRTYIFPFNVLTQPTNPPGVPTVWDSPAPLQDSLADYEMDQRIVSTNRTRIMDGLATIPTISIVTDPRRIWSPTEGFYVRKTYDGDNFGTPIVQPCSVEMIFGDGSRKGFSANAGVHVIGGTSPDDSGTFPTAGWKSRKLSMRLSFSGTFGETKLRYQVFPDSPLDEFDTLILDAGLNNVWHYNGGSSPDDQRRRAEYCRDQYMADLENAVGGTAPHGQRVHVYLNGLYWGLHGLHERPDHRFAAAYHGGDSSEYDVFKHAPSGANNIVNGSNVFAAFGNLLTLARSGLSNNSVYEQIQQVLDVPAFIDYMIVNHWGGNTDWPQQNYYASKRRSPDGRWRFHMWDAEHTLESKSETGPYANSTANSPGELLILLRQNKEFNLLFADHVHRHLFNGGQFYIDPANPVYDANFPERNRPAALFMQRLAPIYPNGLVAESARWGDTAQTGSPASYVPLTVETNFRDQLDSLLGIRQSSAAVHLSVWRYFCERSDFSLNQWRALGLYPTVGAPLFNQFGGLVASGFNLTMTVTNGTIYYTTNGVDPRVYGSGAFSPQAQVYSGPVAINSTTVVKARTLVGSTWSALTEATFTVAELIPPLRITEIMYNPNGGDAYEFLELRNYGAIPINLSGYTIVGIGFTFPPGSVIAPGSTIVLASGSNPSAFADRYPGVSAAGYFSGRLDNGGERLTVQDSHGQTILSVDYDDANGWPTAADGKGYSLELIDPNGDPDDPANWRASSVVNGTPGLAPTAPAQGSIVLNEILAENVAAVNNGGTYPDWVELKNQSGGTVDLGGWSLSDDGDPRKFVFPPGTTISAGGYLVVWCDSATNTTPGLHTGFALDRKDEKLFLYDNNTNRADAMSFGPQSADVSIGRVSGAWKLTQPTPGSANIALTTAPQSSLVINEWLANPAAGSGQDDWIELYNSSAQPVPLKGTHVSVGGALFQLRSLSFVSAHGYVQLFADENPGADHLDLHLPAGGGTIVLYNSDGFQIDRINYSSQIEGVSQGRLPDGASNVASFPGSSSPAAANYLALSQPKPILNEFLALGTAGEGWVELLNTNQVSINLSNIILNTKLSFSGGWTFAPGTTLAPNAFLVVNTGPLDDKSGALYLLNNSGQVLDSIEYGFQIPGMSIGRFGGQWTLLSAATPGGANDVAPVSFGSASNLKINEWMASPGPDENDWFELYNQSGQSPVQLTGLYITDDLSISGQTNSHVGPLSFVAPFGFVRFEASGNPSLGHNHVNFSLDADGDAIRISAPTLDVIDTVSFGAQTTGVSQGRLPDGAANLVNFDAPTPADSNYLPLPNVVINEVLSSPDANFEQAVELYNPSTQSIDISGWTLTDQQGSPWKYGMRPGTVLSGGAYLVLYQNEINLLFDPARGGHLRLSETDAAAHFSGRAAVASFGPASPGKSFGLVRTSVGSNFVEMSASTFGVSAPISVAQFRTGAGAYNSPPRVGPIVISEIMYHPPNIGTNENTADEYIELQNISGSPVTLSDDGVGRSWRMRNAVQFDFLQPTTIPAGAYLLLVNFDPQDATQLSVFRARYGVPIDAPILGPLQGNLSNAGESIELYRPQNYAGGVISDVLVERITYDDLTPWPTNADGGGGSLQRLQLSQYGNDPLNWQGAAPTPGRANPAVPARLPQVIVQPLSRAIPQNSKVEFNVAAAGTSPFSYQWQFNGSDMPAETGQVLAIPNVAAANTGNYRVRVSNSAGSVFSDVASLSIMSLPVISQQPQSQSVGSETNVTFTVGVSGQGPFTYQWRANGFNMPAETNSSLVLLNVQNGQTGDYSVVVGNAAGLVASAVAHLDVFQRVRILTHPQPRTVNAGATTNFTVTASGSGNLRYQWIYFGNPISGATNATLTLINIQVQDSGDYAAIVYDDRSSVVSSNATLSVLVRPTVTQHPASLTVAVGSDSTLQCSAIGGWPMSFRWRRNSQTVYTDVVPAKETNSFYAFSNIQTNQAGTYNVGVVNAAGNSSLSSNAFLTVVIPPTNQVSAAGSNATFTVNAVTPNPAQPNLPRFQWQFNGTNLPNATNASLTLNNVQPSDAGPYSVVITIATNNGPAPATFSATLSLLGTDTDGDGIPDDWEIAHGLDPRNPNDATGDLDGDHMKNLDEYIAGTDPQDPQSYLKIEIVPGGTRSIQFKAVANKSYTIEFKNDLDAATWSRLTNIDAAASDRIVQVPDNSGVATRFYRLRTPKLP